MKRCGRLIVDQKEEKKKDMDLIIMYRDCVGPLIGTADHMKQRS